MKNLLLTCLCFMLCILTVNSQEIINYNKKTEGFNQKDVVRTIIEDRKGNIWTGGTSNIGQNGGAIAADGISKFDGNKWTPFFKSKNELYSGFTSSIFEDSKGNIWVIGKGVSVFDGKNWTQYSRENGLSDDLVFAILEAKNGIIWLATENGICSFDGKNWTIYDHKHMDGMKFISLIEDNDGNIWAGSIKNGLFKFNGTTWELYTTNQGLLSDKISTLAKDKKGNIWIGFFGGGICKFENGKVINNIENGLPKFKLNVGFGIPSIIFIDKDDNVWFSIYGGTMFKDGGLFVYKDSKWIGLNIPETVFINSIIQDRDGALWFGCGKSPWAGFNTTEWGLIKYDYKNDKATKHPLIKGYVISLLEDKKGNIWVGTTEGISLIKPTK